MAMKFCIPEAKEEAYFDKYFEYGDDNDTSYFNLRKALGNFSKAYKETLSFADKAENGEVFDSETAAKAFEELTLSYRFCLEFAELLNEPVQIQIVPGADAGSTQEYINLFLEELFQYSEGSCE